MRLNPDSDASLFPKRANLPHIAGTPAGSAWFWGGNDELGRLNILTPQRRLHATAENVKTGHVVALNLPLNVPGPPFFGRQRMKHKILSIGNGAFGDETSIDTQASSQWDGFRHFADPKTGCFYNGIVSHEIAGDEDIDDQDEPERSRRLGIDAWAKRGIVGRGVLLDIYDWASKEKPYDPFTTHSITASDLRACAKAQNVNFLTGDILLVRTGWLQKYLGLTQQEKDDRAKWNVLEHKDVGLAASDDMKDFLHDGYFAAAAADNANFEAWPPASLEESLHAAMLALWGMPIGELWDLETLSRKCKELGRWTFLLTSAPGNVPGGVGSPPNALAMF